MKGDGLYGLKNRPQKVLAPRFESWCSNELFFYSFNLNLNGIAINGNNFKKEPLKTNIFFILVSKVRPVVLKLF
jgi:hypothetical protein